MTDDRQSPPKRSWVGELMRRRVPQILGLYLGAAWIILEFTNLIVGRYLLSDTWVDMVLITLLALIPTVAMMAWNHGAPGPDEWTRREAVGIGANVAAAIAILVTLFGGEELGAAAYTVETVDEQGNPVVQEVPKADFFSTVQIFFANPDDSLGDDHWLVYAAPVMMETALDQDPFVNAGTLYDGGAEGLIWRAQRAGYRDGLNLPVGLMREIAAASLLDHFVATGLAKRGNEYVMDIQLYQSSPLKRLKEGQVAAVDPYRLMDEAAVFVKEHLDVQKSGTRVADEFPIAELLTPSLPALRHFIEGERLLLFENDPELASAAFQEATSEDPSFARAYFALADTLLEAGDFVEGRKALDQALAYKFRLPEDLQYSARAVAYALDQDFERERALYEMWSRLRPTATEPLNRLALKLAYDFDQPEQALRYFEASYDINPGQDWLLSHIAAVHMSTGRFDQAETLLTRAFELRPDNYLPLATLADMEIRRGNLGRAREHLEQAALVGSDMVTPQTKLAELSLREGDIEQAQRSLETAENIARAPRQTVVILEQQLVFERIRGRPKAALDMLPTMAELQSRYLDPVDNLVDVWMLNMDLYGLANLAEEGEAQLEALGEGLTGPLRGLLDIGRLKLRLGAGDTQGAEAMLEPVENLIEAFNAGAMRYALKLSEAAVKLEQGDPEGAAEAAQSAVDTYRRSTKSAYPMYDYYVMVRLLGTSLRRTGRLEEAVQVLETGLAEWPHHPMLNLELAVALGELGRNDAALSALEKSLEMWRDAEAGYPPLVWAEELATSLGSDIALKGSQG